MKKKPAPTAPASDQPGNPAILLRLPAEIGMPLMRDAGKRHCTVQTIILEIVGEAYGLTDLKLPSRGSGLKPLKKQRDV